MKTTKRVVALLLSVLLLLGAFALAASAASVSDQKQQKCATCKGSMKLIVDYSCDESLEKNYMVFYCEKCKTSKTVELEKRLDHDVEIIPGKEATCSETGLSQGEKCKVCGKVIKEQEATNTKPHVNNGKDFCANCGADMLENRCPYCNKDHGNSFGGKITRFFHNIAYNFQKFFGGK